jgi:Flp pilus assembly protein TadG
MARRHKRDSNDTQCDPSGSFLKEGDSTFETANRTRIENDMMNRTLATSVGRRSRIRSGKALVEFAFVAPLFFLLIVGMIEFGRTIMVMQVMTNAAREGARLAAVGASAETDVVNSVNTYLTNGSVNTAGLITGYPKLTDENNNPINFSTVTAGTKMKVTVRIDAEKVTWLKWPNILRKKPNGATNLTPPTLEASAIMRRE